MRRRSRLLRVAKWGGVAAATRSYCPIAHDLPDGFVQTVQRVWRHSTITLTMDLYAESDAKRLVNAVAALPDVEIPDLKLTG